MSRLAERQARYQQRALERWPAIAAKGPLRFALPFGLFGAVFGAFIGALPNFLLANEFHVRTVVAQACLCAVTALLVARTHWRGLRGRHAVHIGTLTASAWTAEQTRAEMRDEMLLLATGAGTLALALAVIAASMAVKTRTPGLWLASAASAVMGVALVAFLLRVLGEPMPQSSGSASRRINSRD